CALGIEENAHTSRQVRRKHSGLPCAMVCRALPGDRLFDTIAGGPYRQLDACSRGVRTTRFCRRQLRPYVTTWPAPTAACPHVRDVRERPSGGTGWADYAGDLRSKSSRDSENRKFFCPSGQFVTMPRAKLLKRRNTGGDQRNSNWTP